MAIQIRKAQRARVKARVLTTGPSKAGKTLSSILLAYGMAPNGKVLMIDTQNGQGEMYAGVGDIPEYDIIDIEPPFETEKFIEAIEYASEQGYEAIVLDTLTHAWSGPGGLLDLHQKYANRGGNSFTAWSKITPLHDKLIETIQMCNAHIICTGRSKTEYVMDDSSGKTEIKKVGTKTIQRDGIDYEFDFVVSIDRDSHEAKFEARAYGEASGKWDNKVEKISMQTGRDILEFLNTGTVEKPIKVRKAAEPQVEEQAAPPKRSSSKKTVSDPVSDETESW